MPLASLSQAALHALAGALVLNLIAASAHAEESKRIVAVGGTITEVIYELNQQHRLVGVDTTSLYPPQALKEKPNVGYMRQLSAEGVLALQPDLVLAVEAAGPPDALRLLRESGLRLETLPEELSEAGVLHRIRAIGKALDTAAEAEDLARTVEKGFATLTQERARLGRSPRVLFVLSLAKGRVMVGGRNSSADVMIRLAGGTNAAAAIEGYKPLSDEGVIATAPDVILAMKRPGIDPDAESYFGHTALALTPAASKRALISLDGQFLLGLGPRTPEAGLTLLEAFNRFAAAPPGAAEASRPGQTLGQAQGLGKP